MLASALPSSPAWGRRSPNDANESGSGDPERRAGRGAYSVDASRSRAATPSCICGPTSTPWREFYAADAAAAQVSRFRGADCAAQSDCHADDLGRLLASTRASSTPTTADCDTPASLPMRQHGRRDSSQSVPTLARRRRPSDTRRWRANAPPKPRPHPGPRRWTVSTVVEVVHRRLLHGVSRWTRSSAS